jgi:hypothetical protein
LSEAKGSGVKLDANTASKASQLEREYFLRLALNLVHGDHFGRLNFAYFQILRKERSG